MEQPPVNKSTSVIPFIILVFALTIGATLVAKGLDRNAVMGDWANRRCDFPVMMAAPLFKPSDDPRSSAEFAASNFDFCMKDLQSKSLRTAIEPLFSLFKGQVAASTTIADTTNNLRGIMTNIVKDTTGIMLGTFYEQFKKYAVAAGSIAQRMRMAFNRITASTQAMLYMALSTIRAILNGIDFIILVAVIIVTILAILFIILFFVLFPSVPLILAVISILVAAGAEVGSLRETFCFAPHTLVQLEDGTFLPIANLKIGDRVSTGGKVTGVFVFDGTKTPLYNINGVHVAGDHMMQHPITGKWLYVKDYEGAVPGVKPYTRVYCPVIDNRIIPIESERGCMIFRDWEEVDGSGTAADVWERWVWSELNGSIPFETSPAAGAPIGYNNATIRTVKIGDYVRDKNNMLTRVIGLYSGLQGEYAGNWELCNDGVWRRNGSQIAEPGIVYHLVTESGTFIVGDTVVRDATEVGYTRIGESYDTILASI